MLCYASYDKPVFTSPQKPVPLVISSVHPDRQYEWNALRKGTTTHILTVLYGMSLLTSTGKFAKYYSRQQIILYCIPSMNAAPCF